MEFEANSAVLAADAPAEASSTAIEVCNLDMSFPGQRGRTAVHVLRGINLSVADGEFVCLLGQSGCGKTTLLNILAGFLAPTRGTVRIHNEPVLGPDPRRIFIFQEGGVFPWLTVQENIALGIKRRSPVEAASVVRHYVAMVGLTGFESAYPRDLSGGMRQRVELARALAAAPEIIYMDEPFGALDYFTRAAMRADLLRIWRQERKTIVFVTHDIDEAIQLADRVVVFGPRPSSIQNLVTVDLARPRCDDDSRYRSLRHEIVQTMAASLP